jgi:hypothetical protein
MGTEWARHAMCESALRGTKYFNVKTQQHSWHKYFTYWWHVQYKFMCNACYSLPKACSNKLLHIYSSIIMTMIHVRKLALTCRKLLRSADGTVVLQVGVSPDAETKIAWYVMLSRAQTRAREPVSTDGGEKKVYSSPKRSHLLLTFLTNDEREHMDACCHGLKGLSVSVLSDTHLYSEQLMAQNLFVALSSVHWSPLRILTGCVLTTTRVLLNWSTSGLQCTGIRGIHCVLRNWKEGNVKTGCDKNRRKCVEK